MADIKNCTLNFGSGRAAGLTFAALTLACAEIERVRGMRKVSR